MVAECVDDRSMRYVCFKRQKELANIDSARRMCMCVLRHVAVWRGSEGCWFIPPFSRRFFLFGGVLGGGGGGFFSPPPPPPPLGPFLPPLTHRRSGPLDVSMFVSCLLRLEARVFAYLVPDAA